MEKTERKSLAEEGETEGKSGAQVYQSPLMQIDSVRFSPKVAQEMLDIELLELCKGSKYDEAIGVIQSGSSR